MREWKEAFTEEKIAELHSYKQFKMGNTQINAINTSVIDPPNLTHQAMTIIVQMKKGKPSDNLIRTVNDYIKTKKPIYVLQFNDDFLKHFNDFKPKNIQYFKPIETIQNGQTAYLPDMENFYEEYIKFVHNDMREYLKTGYQIAREYEVDLN